MRVEIGASDFLARSNPQAFSGNREKLTHDFAIFSLLSYFGREQFDWQLSTVALSSPTTGQLTQWQRLSTAGDCTEYHSKDVGSLLVAAGNEFHGAPVDIRVGRAGRERRCRLVCGGAAAYRQREFSREAGYMGGSSTGICRTVLGCSPHHTRHWGS